MSDWGTKKAFWWATDWINRSFGDGMKMKVRCVTFERRHIEKYEKQGMFKPDTDFFLYYTWPPIFSLFFPRIWIDLYNKAWLACGKGIKVAKISWWKLVILYELNIDLELVDRYLLVVRMWGPNRPGSESYGYRNILDSMQDVAIVLTSFGSFLLVLSARCWDSVESFGLGQV